MTDTDSTSTPAPSGERKLHHVTQGIIKEMIELDQDARQRVIRTVQTFFGIDARQVGHGRNDVINVQQRHTVLPTGSVDPERHFGGRAELPAKDFLYQKRPATDIERVACLAYYLAHYRDTPHFKTVDISKLNTDAAQLKFANSAYSVTNAANAGLLAPAGKGAKQLSALGEKYVEALPDRDAAKQVLATFKNRKNKRAVKIP